MSPTRSELLVECYYAVILSPIRTVKMSRYPLNEGRAFLAENFSRTRSRAIITAACASFGASRVFITPRKLAEFQGATPICRHSPIATLSSSISSGRCAQTCGARIRQFVSEKYAFEIESAMKQWSDGLKNSPRRSNLRTGSISLMMQLQGAPFSEGKGTKVRSSFGMT